MKILFTVEFYEPRKGGAEEVVKQLAERLARKGHGVTVATSAIPERREDAVNGVRIEPFAIGGNSVSGIRGGAEEIARYRRFLCGDFDVVVNYAAQVWCTDLAFDVLDGMKAAKVLIPCGYSRLESPEFRDYFEQLPAYLKKYDRLIYMSPHYQDKIFGDGHGAANKAVLIPNGAAAEEFLGPDNFKIKEKLGIRTKWLLVSVSNHYVAKGHDFVRRAFGMMKNRKDATLLIVGEKVSGALKNRIGHFFMDYLPCRLAGLWDGRIRLVSGKDRALVISAYRNADLFLFGSRVECAPLVMYESFAGKALFISTEVGNVPDYAEYVALVRTPAEMASAADHFLEDAAEREKKTQKAFSLWERGHTWAAIADEYEKLFHLLCQK